MSSQIDYLKQTIQLDKERIDKIKEEIKDFKEHKLKEIDSIKNKINSNQQIIDRLS